MSTPVDDLLAWVESALQYLSADDVEIVRSEAIAIAARYPGLGERPEREAAMSATLRFLHGELDDGLAGRELVAARLAAEQAYAAALQAAVMAVRIGCRPKATAAREAGIDRMSLLKALGERT